MITVATLATELGTAHNVPRAAVMAALDDWLTDAITRTGHYRAIEGDHLLYRAQRACGCVDCLTALRQTALTDLAAVAARDFFTQMAGRRDKYRADR